MLRAWTQSQADEGRGEIQRMDSGGRANQNLSTGCKGEFRVTLSGWESRTDCQETRRLGVGSQAGQEAPDLHSETLCLRCMWTAMFSFWAKDIREDILEGDMDLGATQPPVILEL